LRARTRHDTPTTYENHARKTRKHAKIPLSSSVEKQERERNIENMGYMGKDIVEIIVAYVEAGFFACFACLRNDKNYPLLGNR
jgi:hypothetical protein